MRERRMQILSVERTHICAVFVRYHVSRRHTAANHSHCAADAEQQIVDWPRVSQLKFKFY